MNTTSIVTVKLTNVGRRVRQRKGIGLREPSIRTTAKRYPETRRSLGVRAVGETGFTLFTQNSNRSIEKHLTEEHNTTEKPRLEVTPADESAFSTIPSFFEHTLRALHQSLNVEDCIAALIRKQKTFLYPEGSSLAGNKLRTSPVLLKLRLIEWVVGAYRAPSN